MVLVEAIVSEPLDKVFVVPAEMIVCGDPQSFVMWLPVLRLCVKVSDFDNELSPWVIKELTDCVVIVRLSDNMQAVGPDEVFIFWAIEDVTDFGVSVRL